MIVRRLLWLSAALAIADAACLAQAQPRFDLTLSSPSWILPGAAIDCDFANQRYWNCSFDQAFVFTRASSGTDLFPSSGMGASFTSFTNNVPRITPNSGYLTEKTSTNQLLNSAVPATQTTGSLATGTYTLWVNGSGTATMSAGSATGCGTGVASQGASTTFTVSVAGTCTVTVAGALNTFQLELGAYGTSFIATAGTIVARSADAAFTIGSLNGLLIGPTASVVMQLGALPSSANQNASFLGASLHKLLGQSNTSSNQLASQDTSGANQIVATFGASTYSAASKAGLSWGPGARSVVGNSGTVATSAASLISGAIGGVELGSAGFSNQQTIDGYIGRLTVWNTRISDAALAAATN